MVASAGATNAGTVDDLAGVADVCADRGLWFHVDGAYGGGGAARPVASGRCFDGIERADSFIVDPHKWLFAPYDACALLYRDPSLALARAPAAGLVPRHGALDARLEPGRLRLPPVAARARPPAVVLARDLRHRRLSRRRRAGPDAHATDGERDRRATRTSSS